MLRLIRRHKTRARARKFDNLSVGHDIRFSDYGETQKMRGRIVGVQHLVDYPAAHAYFVLADDGCEYAIYPSCVHELLGYNGY